MQRVGIAMIPHNDIGLDASGNLALVRDAEAVGQHARQRLSFYKGEYFLDTNVGVDWLGTVLGQQPRAVVIAEAMAKKVILDTPGVTGILELQSDFDRLQRGVFVRRCLIETEYDAISLPI
ncbi:MULTISPECIES: hypothetical protein [unclassified Beijerinckia]|uniref:hypothetical protein n=1 Tax=unclassified Beijerinckia TaxID=2638183 RepID=UPI000894D8D2|nr:MULTISPECIES: hypothetical protein [unclassified Beijerinckia]MDH7794131.1 hypothetical protein [Beijerinckia sp. GAS462]SEB53973.1 hypothetical protein SAMN05443249_0396 [Beijerinckia sp. 28-YEA-48]